MCMSVARHIYYISKALVARSFKLGGTRYLAIFVDSAKTTLVFFETLFQPVLHDL